MSFLALHIVSLVLFHQLLYYSDRCKIRPAVSGAVNYLVGAICLLGWFLVSCRGQSVHLPVVLLGAGNGLLYVTHLFVLIATYRKVGVGISTAIIGAGVVAPVIISWAVWGESMTPLRWAALVLIPVALYLMRPAGKETARGIRSGIALLIICFLFAALILTIHKAAAVYGGAERSGQYQTALFVTAAVYALIILKVKKHRVSRQAMALGSAVGVANVFVLAFLMLALTRIPAVIAYPTGGSLTIFGNLTAGALLWKDRPARRQLAGAALAVAIVIATNL